MWAELGAAGVEKGENFTRYTRKHTRYLQSPPGAEVALGHVLLKVPRNFFTRHCDFYLDASDIVRFLKREGVYVRDLVPVNTMLHARAACSM